MPSIGIYNWSTAIWNDPLDANAPIWRDTNGVQGGQVPPSLGACIVVPNGTTLILDEPAPPELAGITVEGTLSFANINIDLDVDFIDVAASGALEVGTETTPITAQVNIRLTDNHSGCGPGAGESMSIRVFGGRIDMHGTPPAPTWTRVSQTVTTNDAVLTLQDEVDWPDGATIVIASTDFDPDQTEERVIDNDTIIGSGSGTVRFRVDRLDHMHYGASEGPYNGLSVDMYAEVAVLERNIKVFTDMAILGERCGQIRIMSDTEEVPGGNPPVARLDGIEVTGLGEYNEMGIYPIHFHHAGDVGSTGSYVKNCSIHHNDFRALTIHDTQNLDVSHNLAYKTWGHAFYLENGNETGNTFAWNVALNIRAIQEQEEIVPIVPSDAEPAGFYIGHPLNVFNHNVAAASEGHGFYYEQPPTPDNNPLRFLHNVAHSNRMKGYFLDYQYRPTSSISLGDFTAYKNGEYGLWLRTRSEQTLSGLRMADNRSGLYLASGGWQDPDDSRITVRDSLIVGESANVGEHDGTDDFEVALGRSLPNPHPQLTWPATLVGVDIYDGHIHIHNTTFANFTNHTINTTTRQAAAFSQVQKLSSWAVDPRNRVSALSFINANRVWFRDGNNEMGAINAMLVDEDGTLTGLLAGHGVIANEAFLYPNGALPVNTMVDPVTGADWNAQVVDRNSVSYGQFQLINLDHDDRPVRAFELHATSGGEIMRVEHPDKDVNRFATNLLIGMDPMTGNLLHYDLQYPNLQAPARWPPLLRLKLRSGPAGEGIVLSLPLEMPPATGVMINGAVAGQVFSLATLVPGTWMYDAATQKLWLSLEINPGSEPAPLDNQETLVEIR